MGYTHYWRQYRDFTDKEWEKVAAGVTDILDRATAEGIALGDGMGEGDPEFKDGEILFNGAGEEAYETLYLSKIREPRPSWVSTLDYERSGAHGFCKTARRPYDPVVVSVLNFLATEFPAVVGVASDGAEEGIPTEDSQFYP